MKSTYIETNKLGVLDYAPVGLCVIDSAYTVLFWNRCLEDWTGIPSADITGKDLGSCFPKLKKPKYLTRLATIFEGGPPAIFSSQLHGNIFPSPLPDGATRIQHTTSPAYRQAMVKTAMPSGPWRT